MIDKIFGEKDGDPVEGYPVWNDEYLKNIRDDVEITVEKIKQGLKITQFKTKIIDKQGGTTV